MENWKNIIKSIEKWSWTKRIPGTTIKEDEEIFIKELNNEYILIKRRDVHEVIFEPKAIPPEGIVDYCDADHEAMDQINKEIDDRTDDLAEEETELNDAKTKDIPWDRLMMKKNQYERKANVIINNFDLFL